MTFRYLPSPALFEGPVARYSFAFDPEDIASDETWANFFDPAALPESLARAVPKRKAEFLAGRDGARRALAELGHGADALAAPLPIGPDRAPVWPPGFVGSITHTHGFVSAAVARAARVRSLGLDSERVMSAATADNVRSLVACEGELEALAGAGFEAMQLLTLVFSAKETLYKCLRPLVGTFFGFHEARLASVDAAAGRYVIGLTGGLNDEFGPGARFAGRFVLGDGLVHTGMELPAVERAPAGGGGGGPGEGPPAGGGGAGGAPREGGGA